MERPHAALDPITAPLDAAITEAKRPARGRLH